MADPCLYLNLIMNAGSAWLTSAFNFYITTPFLRAVFVALLFICFAYALCRQIPINLMYGA